MRAAALAIVTACALCVVPHVAHTQAPAVASASAPAEVLRRDQRRLTVGVATRPLARGAVLQASDIAYADTVIAWRWSNAEPDTTRALPGWVTHRAVAAGEVLRAPAVSAPPVVAAGATVKAIWQDGPLTLVVSGVAINAASLGAPVGVRIDRTRRLDGIAVAPNTVRLR
jgi:flagellar basal body P-ring formation protein FlgA